VDAKTRSAPRRFFDAPVAATALLRRGCGGGGGFRSDVCARAKVSLLLLLGVDGEQRENAGFRDVFFVRNLEGASQLLPLNVEGRVDFLVLENGVEMQLAALDQKRVVSQRPAPPRSSFDVVSRSVIFSRKG